MNNLVFISDERKPVTTSRMVARIFNKEHSKVTRDIVHIQEKCSDEFNTANFGDIKYRDNRGRTQLEFIMTKDGFTLLVMGYTGTKAMEFKLDYISKFNEMEAQLNQPLSDDLIVLRALEIATSRLKEKEKIIEEQKPKVEYYEEVLNSSTLITTSVVAQNLGMTARKLNQILKEKGVQKRISRSWVLCSEYKDKGYAKIVTYTYTDAKGDIQTTHLLKWTEKGREFIHSLVGGNSLSKAS